MGYLDGNGLKTLWSKNKELVEKLETKVTDGDITAKKAERDSNGNVISTTYSTKTELNTQKSRIDTIDGKFNGSSANRAVADSNGNVISSTYATKNEVNSKQDTLVSGTNIKTVNGLSIVGDGNLDVGNAVVPTFNIGYVRNSTMYHKIMTIHGGVTWGSNSLVYDVYQNGYAVSPGAYIGTISIKCLYLGNYTPALNVFNAEWVHKSARVGDEVRFFARQDGHALEIYMRNSYWDTTIILYERHCHNGVGIIEHMNDFNVTLPSDCSEFTMMKLVDNTSKFKFLAYYQDSTFNLPVRYDGTYVLFVTKRETAPRLWFGAAYIELRHGLYYVTYISNTARVNALGDGHNASYDFYDEIAYASGCSNTRIHVYFLET